VRNWQVSAADETGDMPKRRRNAKRRTPSQAAADARSEEIAVFLGRALKDARGRSGELQGDLSEKAGVAQSTFSEAEHGKGASFSLAVWVRMCRAVGSDLRAYLDQVSGADQPRDHVHLRNQELIAQSGQAGGWTIRAEAAIDRDPSRTRSADVLLTRPGEHAIFEVIDWFDDVGATLRGWERRVARVGERAIAGMSVAQDGLPRACGCWVVRRTQRNRDLVAAHPAIFRASFPGSARRWLAALTDPATPMPDTPALLWVTVAGDRLIPANLG
jgi:transcriptional regulator with XRE-family HTH domain